MTSVRQLINFTLSTTAYRYVILAVFNGDNFKGPEKVRIILSFKVFLELILFCGTNNICVYHICIYLNQVVCREADITIFTENNFYN